MIKWINGYYYDYHTDDEPEPNWIPCTATISRKHEETGEYLHKLRDAWFEPNHRGPAWDAREVKFGGKKLILLTISDLMFGRKVQLEFSPEATQRLRTEADRAHAVREAGGPPTRKRRLGPKHDPQW